MVWPTTPDGRSDSFGMFTPLLHVADETGRSRWEEPASIAIVPGGETGKVAVAAVEAAALVPGAERS